MFTNSSNCVPIGVKSYGDSYKFWATHPQVVLPKRHEPRCLVSAQIGTEIQRRICLMQVSLSGEGVRAFREVSGVCEASICCAVAQSHLLRLK